jgi:hypothetical protein
MTHATAPSTTRPVSRATPLLSCGIAAGPLYIATVALQVLARDGFDIRRHAASLLSNGDLGWIQIANFLVTGLLTIAGATGVRRALGSRPGGTWGPRLIALFGVSLLAAGVFVADPAFGFPAGTADGPPTTVSWHGIVHFAAGGIGFLGLIAACLVFARSFAAAGQKRWAAFSAATGVIYLVAFAGIASGQQRPGLNVAFSVAVVLGWTWLSALSARLRRDVRAGEPVR